MTKLTPLQLKELRLIGKKGSISPGEANDLRVAANLERKGLVVLVREWSERFPGAPRDSICRAYRLTEDGAAALVENSK